MQHDPNQPVILTSVSSEMEAAMIVASLNEMGVDAQVEGALTSAMRAEVPGEVHVLVRSSDLPRARGVLADRGDA